jgi:hypothetical protein
LKKLLIETLPIRIEPSTLTESFAKNNGRLIVKNMKIQQADKPNKNRRIYSRPILEREAKRLFENCRQIESRGIIGELDHFDNSIINLKNACLGVLDYRWKGNDMLGDVEILNTPNGNILREIITAGYVPGISSRGMGSIRELNEEEGLVEVEDDFELVTWDAVSDPSSQNAYFKEIRESRQLKESFNGRNVNPNNVDKLMQAIICELSGVCCIK